VFTFAGLGAKTMCREWKGGDRTNKFEKHCTRQLHKKHKYS